MDYKTVVPLLDVAQRLKVPGLPAACRSFIAQVRGMARGGTAEVCACVWGRGGCQVLTPCLHACTALRTHTHACTYACTACKTFTTRANKTSIHM